MKDPGSAQDYNGEIEEERYKKLRYDGERQIYK